MVILNSNSKINTIPREHYRGSLICFSNWVRPINLHGCLTLLSDSSKVCLLSTVWYCYKPSRSKPKGSNSEIIKWSANSKIFLLESLSVANVKRMLQRMGFWRFTVCTYGENLVRLSDIQVHPRLAASHLIKYNAMAISSVSRVKLF